MSTEQTEAEPRHHKSKVRRHPRAQAKTDKAKKQIKKLRRLKLLRRQEAAKRRRDLEANPEPAEPKEGSNS